MEMENDASFASSAGMAASHVVDDYPDPYDIMILIVEEDPAYLATITAMLQRHGYHVTGKASPEEGLRALQENPKGFDLVMSVAFTQGPGIDGFELLKHATGHPVILFADDSVPRETVMRAFAGGVSDFLRKPLRDKELCMIWQRVLQWKMFNDKASGDDDKAYTDGQSIDKLCVFIPPDGTGRKRGSEGLDGSDKAVSNSNLGRTTKKTNFNSPPQQHVLVAEVAEQLRAMEIDDLKKGSEENAPPHCQDKCSCGRT